MGAATRNPWTCLGLIPACGRRQSQLIHGLAKRRTPTLICIPTASPQPRFSVSGKPNFAIRDRRGKNGGVNRRPSAETQTDRGAPLWGAGRLEPHLLTVWLLVRVRPAPPRISALPEISPFVGMPINSETLRASSTYALSWRQAAIALGSPTAI